MIDTADKRASVLGVANPTRVVLPTPDGAIDLTEDRAQVAYCYRMEAAVAPEPGAGGVGSGGFVEPPAYVRPLKRPKPVLLPVRHYSVMAFFELELEGELAAEAFLSMLTSSSSELELRAGVQAEVHCRMVVCAGNEIGIVLDGAGKPEMEFLDDTLVLAFDRNELEEWVQ